MNYFTGGYQGALNASAATNLPLPTGGTITTGTELIGIDLDCSQTGWGFTPVIGLDAKLGKLNIGEDVPEVLACDLKVEQAGQALLKEGIAHCESVRDYVSRDLLLKLLDETEEHIDHIETQLGLIEQVGLANYLQSQMDAS